MNDFNIELIELSLITEVKEYTQQNHLIKGRKGEMISKKVLFIALLQ